MGYCARCRGEGQVERTGPGMDSSVTELCPDCKGKTKKAPNGKCSCDGTGLVVWTAGGETKVDPCFCLLNKGIEVMLHGGKIKVNFVEGGGVVLVASDFGGCDGSPPDELEFTATRAQLKNLIKAMKKSRSVMKALGMK